MTPKKDNYITPRGYQKLQDEHNHLLRFERPEITNLIQWAASNGDRSENADYLYGRRRLREIDRRLRFLSQRLQASVVIEPQGGMASQVQFGATVEVRDEEECLRRYTIIGVDEIDTESGRISWQSPVGRALLGKKVGDEVTVYLPAGEITLEVVSIEYQ